MGNVEVKITFNEKSGKIRTVITTENKNASEMARRVKGIAVTLTWLKLEARRNKTGMLAALSALISTILNDDDEPKQREIKIDREELMRQILELKEEEENGKNS